MEKQDIRWIQRFDNFNKALEQLTKFINEDSLNELEEQGLIQSFEYNYELAWNTIKDYFENQGETGILVSRDAFRLAFKIGLIDNGEIWMKMIASRIQTTHTYDKKIAKEVVESIINIYYDEFISLQKRLLELKKNIK